MTKRMLIDASHAEETRVVVLEGNRLEDYDVETATKKQLKGNIYLAKIVRVEPSLQAAFVEYGGNRHGFLALGEIHPDYYQIPVADRQRLLQLQEEEAEAERLEDERRAAAAEAAEAALAIDDEGQAGDHDGFGEHRASETGADAHATAGTAETGDPVVEAAGSGGMADGGAEPDADGHAAPIDPDGGERAPEAAADDDGHGEDRSERRSSQRLLRHYKIQEVIRRRQIVLVQVVKEERGSKGAALTTYISLAGRYSVLMPNSPRGGGVSRKITSAADRRRLKEITTELAIPRGMAMIVRTAGAQRPKPEIKRDCEYLLRLWDDIRDTTMAAVAPALIHEEASLIKRAIRDVYANDFDDIQVDGEQGWRAARDFMRTLMPPNARKVQLWRDGTPLFARHGVEGMLDSMLSPNVQLRSGGYLVINQAEALVAIDVNSGRSTRERGIEETALRTNLEAADEVARQLRLRDLAGLIVIDFIDMESRRHNAMVERRIKDALRHDRARIQVGAISAFGLLEMSRQRLRPSLAESSFSPCPHCGGTGLQRSTESASLHVLRAIEAAGAGREIAELTVTVAPPVALYILNQKRAWLAEVERRCVMQVEFATDDVLEGAAYRLIRTRTRAAEEIPPAPAARTAIADGESRDDRGPASFDAPSFEDPSLEAPSFEARAFDAGDRPEAGDGFDEGGDVADDDRRATRERAAVANDRDAAATDDEDGERKRGKRRRRRKRGGRREDEAQAADGAEPIDAAAGDADDDAVDNVPVVVSGEPMLADMADASASGEPETGARASDAIEGDGAIRAGDAEDDRGGRKRRGRRGGRRRRRDGEDGDASVPEGAEPRADAPPVPRYTGPTPADPFGGAYDIFEALERDEALPDREPVVLNPAATAASVARPVPNEPPAPISAADLEPGPTPLPPHGADVPPFVAAPEPEPDPEPDPEPEAQPAVRPFVIGASTENETGSRRRLGWWRR